MPGAGTRSPFLDEAEDTGEWMRRGWCREATARSEKWDSWFPESGEAKLAAAVKWACDTVCPVRAECLAYALTHHPQAGIWGGTSLPERTRMLRRTARAAS